MHKRRLHTSRLDESDGDFKRVGVDDLLAPPNAKLVICSAINIRQVIVSLSSIAQEQMAYGGHRNTFIRLDAGTK